MGEAERRVSVIANWSLATTATTADQEIGTRTPLLSAYVITAIIIEVYRTVISATAALLGTVSIRISGVPWITLGASNNTASSLFGAVIPIPMGEEVKTAKTVDAVCTPTDVTSTTWRVTLIGYER